MEILIPILAVTVIGLICAVGLAVASSVMAVKEDTRLLRSARACPAPTAARAAIPAATATPRPCLSPARRRISACPARTRSRRRSRRCSAWRPRTWWKRSPSCSAPAPAGSSRPTTAVSPPGAAAKLFYGGNGSFFGCMGFTANAPGLPAERHLHAGRHRLRQPHLVHRLRHLRADLPAEDHRDRAGYHPHRGPLLELSQRPVHPKVCSSGCIGCHKCEKDLPAGRHHRSTTSSPASTGTNVPPAANAPRSARPAPWSPATSPAPPASSPTNPATRDQPGTNQPQQDPCCGWFI